MKFVCLKPILDVTDFVKVDAGNDVVGFKGGDR
jgi:hypothetical protein